MSGETSITIVGRLTDDPALRFTPSGAAVANFTIASNARKLNKQTNEWEDEPPMFLSCAVWRQYAENVAESLQKGMQVIVVGRLKSRTYEAKDGTNRTVFEIDVDEVGPALRYATANVSRTSKGSGGGQQRSSGGGRQQQGGGDPWGGGGGDPWGGGSGGDPWGNSADAEPPF